MLLNETQITMLREAIYAMQFALKEAERRCGDPAVAQNVPAFVAAWDGAEVNIEMWRMVFILRMAEQAIDRHERGRRRSLRALREANKRRKKR